MLVLFSLHLVCGNIWISKVSHKLDSVFQQVFQPFDLLELFLFFLPALQKVVASHGLSGVTFAFLSSKQGRDQVHPLAMLLPITILFVALTPVSPLAPFAVNGYGGGKRNMVLVHPQWYYLNSDYSSRYITTKQFCSN